MFHSKKRSRTILSMAAALSLTAVTSLGLATAGTTLAAEPAYALCSGTSPATGDWHNIDPNTRSITRAIVDWGCPDQPGLAAGYVRLFGKCHPTDCDWGVRRTYAENGGWESATYRYSWSTKYVWIRPYSFHGLTYLRVWVHTDFTPADGRTDYTTDEWMLK